ncbi:hypothetical protein Cgig2_000345 [Carnegiea gigantea]|uniref:Uncharacterized protein n=1 Tax=Carnegiea gigantea TaxID=171969 RepID=A0A9Q1KDT3_9CARY|nr:hypothetical protein Cgig2_000345 [Carnegiea gigantea]
MGFPRSLMTDEMVLYILGNFEWYHREVVSPTGLYHTIIESYARTSILLGRRVRSTLRSTRAALGGRLKRWLTTSGKASDGIEGVPHTLHVHSQETTGGYAEEALHDFELPEIVEATIYAMLLNDAAGLGIVSGFIVADLKASLKGLQWTYFESWMYVNRRGLLEAQLHQRSPPGGARGPVNSHEESSDSNDPPLPSSDEDSKSHGPRSERRKMIFLPNFTSTEQAAEYIRDTFRWPLRESSALHLNLLPEDYHGLCLGFDLSMATQYAHNSSIPEMVQAIFYAIVLNDTAGLGLSNKIDMNCTMPIL